jgi:hypothetical protein
MTRHPLPRSHAELGLRSAHHRHILTRLHCASLQQVPPRRPQHGTHSYAAPTYGTMAERLPPVDDSALLPPAGLTRLQKITGELLYYAHAVYSILLVALDTLALAQAKGAEATAQAATHLLIYCPWHARTRACTRKRSHRPGRHPSPKVLRYPFRCCRSLPRQRHVPPHP